MIHIKRRYPENNRQCPLFLRSYVNSRCAFGTHRLLSCINFPDTVRHVYYPSQALKSQLCRAGMHAKLCSGVQLSRMDLAASGSMEYTHRFSQSKVLLASAILSSRSRAWGIFLEMSAAWAAIREAIMPCFTSSILGRARCSAGVT